MDVIYKNRSKSAALLPISRAFYESNSVVQSTLDSYNKIVEAIKKVLAEAFYREEELVSQNGDVIKYNYKFHQVNAYMPGSNEMKTYKLPITPSNAIRNGATLVMLITSSLKVEATKIPSGHKSYSLIKELSEIDPSIDIKELKEVETRKIVEIKDKYRTPMPLIVGSDFDQLTLFPKELSRAYGEDPDDAGGYFIIDGLQRSVSNVFSRPYNHPIFVQNNFDDNIIRMELMTQKDVEYGTSRHIVALIVSGVYEDIYKSEKTKAPSFDLCFEFRDYIGSIKTVDRKARANRIPLRLLMMFYGCKSDKEIVDYIYPPSYQENHKINFIKNAFLYGKYHSKLNKNVTERYILLYIANEIFKDENKDEIRERADKDVAEYTSYTSYNGDIENLRKVLYENRLIKAAKKVMSEYFLFGMNDDNEKVCMIIGEIFSKMINIFFGERDTDRDSTAENVIHQVGEQLIGEFKTAHRDVNNEVHKIIVTNLTTKRFETIEKDLESELSSKIENISKNVFNVIKDKIKSSRKQLKGQPRLMGELIQQLSAMHMWAKCTESAIRPNAGMQQAKVIYPQRQVHFSHALYFCPHYTPEGSETVGRYPKSTLYMKISNVSAPDKIMEEVKKSKNFREKLPTLSEIQNFYKIKINGVIMGVIERGEKVWEFVNHIKKIRRENPTIDPTISIYVDDFKMSIEIHTYAGRAYVPLIPIDKLYNKSGKLTIPKKSKTKLLEDGKENPPVAEHPIESKSEELSLPQDLSIFEYIDAIENLRKSNEEFEMDFEKVFIRTGYCEYIDTREINNCCIAENIEDIEKHGNIYTHIILPVAGVSPLIALNPAVDKNVAMRAILSTNHFHQAISKPIKNPAFKMGPAVNILYAPEDPVTQSAFYSILDMRKYAYGENVSIGFMPKAINQEDALGVNQGAIDRFMLCAIHYETIIVQLESNNSSFGLVPYNKLYKKQAPEYAYRKVDPTEGIPLEIWTEFWKGDVIASISKILTQEELASIEVNKMESEYTKTDESRLYNLPDGKGLRHSTPGYVVSVNKAVNGISQTKSITIASIRFLDVGDKVSSLHGQKGVVGKCIPEVDCPYTQFGERLVLLFNHPTILKRQTYAQSEDACNGKIGAVYGCRIDSTPYITKIRTGDITYLIRDYGYIDIGENLSDYKPIKFDSTITLPDDFNDIETETINVLKTYEAKWLKELEAIKKKDLALYQGYILSIYREFDSYKEVVYNGETGERYKSKIFVGTAFYIRHRHMVYEKQNVRNRGRREQFTRQPAKSGTEKGGMKIGNMERDCIINSGSIYTLLDCFYARGTPEVSFVCPQCKGLAYLSRERDGSIKCDRCGVIPSYISSEIITTYNYKLVYNIFKSAGIMLETYVK